MEQRPSISFHLKFIFASVVTLIFVWACAMFVIVSVKFSFIAQLFDISFEQKKKKTGQILIKFSFKVLSSEENEDDNRKYDWSKVCINLSERGVSRRGDEIRSLNVIIIISLTSFNINIIQIRSNIYFTA